MLGSKLLFRNIKRLLLAFGLFPLSLACRLFPRSKKIWVFGNQSGFRDNSRYLFEYSTEKLPAIRSVWMAHTEEIWQEVRAAGFEVVRTNSLAGRWLLLRAGVGVISNGFGDLSRGLIGGMYIVQLWHGLPLKKILLDFPGDWQLASQGSFLGRLLNATLRFTYRVAWRGNSLIIATSKSSVERMTSAFGVPRERVAITGTPRVDILLGRDEALLEEDARLRESLLANVDGLEDGEKSCQIVLYAPTWREDCDESCLWESFDAEEIDRRMEELNAVLAIRLHPFSQATVYEELERKHLSHIVPVRGKIDFQTLLRCSDVLITDYSSGCADYSVLMRPVVFFTPDFEKYGGSRDFYEPLEELTLGRQCATWQEVVEQVAQGIAGDEAAMEVSENLRKRFNEFDDTANRERIVAEIFQRVGLR